MKQVTTLMECRHCDYTMSHRINANDVPVCLGCGAEWTPIAVSRTQDEIDKESRLYEQMLLEDKRTAMSLLISEEDDDLDILNLDIDHSDFK